jgi:hypothetical protein
MLIVEHKVKSHLLFFKIQVEQLIAMQNPLWILLIEIVGAVDLKATTETVAGSRATI